ncbi:hypothetical protein [Actinoalloteichus spitiensis]|uniref:hypothetical protein n=1 Tax=Actinoalloteichus spitiensis TaxID=252394 RepID=UPI0012F70082|nr:hypothetical protein [Actinoalloteichus spitiensis]
MTTTTGLWVRTDHGLVRADVITHVHVVGGKLVVSTGVPVGVEGTFRGLGKVSADLPALCEVDEDDVEDIAERFVRFLARHQAASRAGLISADRDGAFHLDGVDTAG